MSGPSPGRSGQAHLGADVAEGEFLNIQTHAGFTQNLGRELNKHRCACVIGPDGQGGHPAGHLPSLTTGASVGATSGTAVGSGAGVSQAEQQSAQPLQAAGSARVQRSARQPPPQAARSMDATTSSASTIDKISSEHRFSSNSKRKIFDTGKTSPGGHKGERTNLSIRKGVAEKRCRIHFANRRTSSRRRQQERTWRSENRLYSRRRSKRRVFELSRTRRVVQASLLCG